MGIRKDIKEVRKRNQRKFKKAKEAVTVICQEPAPIVERPEGSRRFHLMLGEMKTRWWTKSNKQIDATNMGALVEKMETSETMARIRTQGFKPFIDMNAPAFTVSFDLTEEDHAIMLLLVAGEEDRLLIDEEITISDYTAPNTADIVYVKRFSRY